MRSTSTNSMMSPVSVNTPLSMRGTAESELNVVNEEQADNDKIVEVGNDLISPKHSAMSNESEALDIDSVSMEREPQKDKEAEDRSISTLSTLQPQHRAPAQNRSILGMLEMHSIVEESSIATQENPQSKVNLLDFAMDIADDYGDDDDELTDPKDAERDQVDDTGRRDNNQDSIHGGSNENDRKSRPRASSRHRTVRQSRKHRGMSSFEDDKDQTPMELAVSQSQHNKKPTTLGGHRYIPSYDSQMSEQGLILDMSGQSRGRSSSYRPWNGNDRGRNHSYLSDIGNLDQINYEVSEIQDWPMEGTENALDHLSIEKQDSGEPMIVAQRYRDDSVTPRAISSLMPPAHHVVMESDDHVGDSIF